MAASLAMSKYPVRRIVLFGSVVSGRFHEGSDVDLCVEGLPQNLYYPLVGDLEKALAPLRPHLVLAEDLGQDGADRALRDEILARGVVLG